MLSIYLAMVFYAKYYLFINVKKGGPKGLNGNWAFLIFLMKKLNFMHWNWETWLPPTLEKLLPTAHA
jgi:hypothetical protein